MSIAPETLSLFTVPIRTEQDIVLARQQARQLASKMGFEGQVLTRIATSLSEIARNAFQYAGGGEVEFSVQGEPSPTDPRRTRQTLLMAVRDTGPGIARLDDVLSGHYRSESGLGIGIVGTQRLMDRVEIASGTGGTTVTLAKILPAAILPQSAAQLRAFAETLAREAVPNPLQEVRVQNQELLRTMEETNTRQEELTRVNQELAETNTGVLALYDELETLNRISVMLASKLELRPLIQSIMDVTTSITDAELGAFFFLEENRGWSLYALAGPRADALDLSPPDTTVDFFTPDFEAGNIIHISDLSAEETSSSLAPFARTVAARMPVRTCLAVAVSDAGGRQVGSLLFASPRPGAFSERSERILTSVAMQAAVGIEKAQLFQSVTAASDAKDRFFATLSHELRTPLNPALAIVSSLEGDPRVPPELREEIAIIARNIRLEARLIDDLLDFNRLIKGKFELLTDTVDVHELIESVIAICREELHAKQHRLERELQAQRSTVLGDAGRLQQVLWNVLKNAIKFTPPGGLIRIRTLLAGEWLRVEISDTGRGIEAGSIERIFGAFDQGRMSPSAQLGGLGLGLAIARMFVELHRGTITASSPGVGQGATMTIDLPLCEAPAGATAEAAHPRPAQPAGHQRILLVDDHVDTLRGLTRLLERRGYEVTPAPTAAQALAEAERQEFDLLISDLGLPDASGHDLVRLLNARKPIPAIALSGYGMENDRTDSKDAGFSTHITKPVDFEQLIGAIQALLDRPA